MACSQSTSPGLLGVAAALDLLVEMRDVAALQHVAQLAVILGLLVEAGQLLGGLARAGPGQLDGEIRT